MCTEPGATDGAPNAAPSTASVSRRAALIGGAALAASVHVRRVRRAGRGKRRDSDSSGGRRGLRDLA